MGRAKWCFGRGQTSKRSPFFPCNAIDTMVKTLHRLEGAKSLFQSLWEGPVGPHGPVDPPASAYGGNRHKLGSRNRSITTFVCAASLLRSIRNSNTYQILIPNSKSLSLKNAVIYFYITVFQMYCENYHFPLNLLFRFSKGSTAQLSNTSTFQVPFTSSLIEVSRIATTFELQVCCYKIELPGNLRVRVTNQPATDRTEWTVSVSVPNVKCKAARSSASQVCDGVAGFLKI